MNSHLPARVGRLVDAAADNHVRADRGAAGADPDVIGIRRRDVDRTDRSGRRDLPVANRRPRDAGIVGFPHAAADAAEIKRVRLLPHAGVRGDASATRRADAAPFQILVGVRRHQLIGVALRGDARGGGSGEDQGGQRDGSRCTHQVRVSHRSSPQAKTGELVAEKYIVTTGARFVAGLLALGDLRGRTPALSVSDPAGAST